MRPPFLAGLLATGLMAVLLAVGLLAPVAAHADEPPVFRMQMKDRKFDPPRLVVPAGVRFVLMVRNAGDTPAEFESGALNVEKIISAGREATVRLGPLKPGEYPVVDDFHQETKGTLVVSEN
jgi:hypothetical protein